MMISKRMKLVILTGLIILTVGIITGYLNGFRTDPVPPGVRAGWYLPEQDITGISSGNNLSRNDHLILTGWRDGPAPQFPDLSPYCRYENFTSRDTGHNYLIAAWYFNDDRRFLASRELLRDFLETTGKITTVELNYTGFATTEDQNGLVTQEVQDKGHVPMQMVTTGYESPNTSGLFFTIEIPGLKSNNEHYIVYYGTTDPEIPGTRTQVIRELIGETYTYDRGASTGPI